MGDFCSIKASRLPLQISAYSPLRIDIAGGVTDVPAISERIGTSVINIAIDLFKDSARKNKIPFYAKISTGYTDTSIVMNNQIIKSNDFLKNQHFLSKLLAYSMGENPTKNGIRLRVVNGLPAGTGLGASSSLCISVLACLQKLIKTNAHPDIGLIRDAHYFETVICGAEGGVQDYIAAYYGGYNYIDFSTLSDENMIVNSRFCLSLPRLLEDFLNRNMFIIIQRSAGTDSSLIVKDEIDQVLKNNADSIRCLRVIKQGNNNVRELLNKPFGHEEIKRLCFEVNKTWSAQKRLTPLLLNKKLRTIEEIVRPYAHAIRGPGSGGNSLFLIAKEGAHTQLLKHLDGYGSDITILYAKVNNTGLNLDVKSQAS